ncbi:hypothetical protein GYMLUDRAFT_45166 [Collybiopsis luxurians FD-317 M1]|uniref:Unplaced genomic scaffold GYMLUscaffold_36, whole genome shotgun sequence n=1 Tax=Collybiopsis luxurians FD-317 M1 TaxID=944289 RepID=A0A0D0B5C9_9AGAR|nr:hypothetical protein GYMLUDRAFT_45166 [Collybiopsis luxurians FD-317 M1]
MTQRTRQKQRASMDSFENPFITPFKPPENETEEERIHRARALQDAQRVSREIDESLQETKRLLDRRKKGMRILLLGQAESGKSAVLKNFQLAFTPNQFRKERGVWKTIIQLNLISSVKAIFNVLNETESEFSTQLPLTPPQSPGSSVNNSKLRRIHLSLKPLLSMDADLNKILFSAGSTREICVAAGSRWKFKLGFRDSTSTRESSDSNSDLYHLTNAQNATRNNFVKLLEASKDDIISLWQDENVQSSLEEQGVDLRASPGFFMDDVERIAASGYQPTDSDIVRARVRTVGVEEHHLVAESIALKGSDFYITDVSGMRSSRSSWIPFFDDSQAILFLAPLTFNQMLDEDNHVNRLEDSLMLWKDICKNELLANCNIIIFFNKMDILRRTLQSGVEVRKFVPSYGDAPNDVASVTKYFKDRFKTYHKKLSPKPRSFISHETSAIDVHSTTALVVTVHDGIIRENLQRSDMI